MGLTLAFEVFACIYIYINQQLTLLIIIDGITPFWDLVIIGSRMRPSSYRVYHTPYSIHRIPLPCNHTNHYHVHQFSICSIISLVFQWWHPPKETDLPSLEWLGDWTRPLAEGCCWLLTWLFIHPLIASARWGSRSQQIVPVLNHCFSGLMLRDIHHELWLTTIYHD